MNVNRELFDELEAIRELWPNRYRSEATPEYQEKLQALYDTLWSDGSWKCDSGSAAMVTVELACLKIHQREWTESVVILNQWLQEPGFQETDKVEAFSLVNFRADCHSQLRDLELLINDLTLLKQQDTLMGARSIMWTIESALAQDWIQDPLPADLRELAAWAVKRLTRLVKLARAAAAAVTAMEMKAVVEAARQWETRNEALKWRRLWVKQVREEGQDSEISDSEILALYDEWEALGQLDDDMQSPEILEYCLRVETLFGQVYKDGIWRRGARESAVASIPYIKLSIQRRSFVEAVTVSRSWLARADIPEGEEYLPALFKQKASLASFNLGDFDTAESDLLELAKSKSWMSRRFALCGLIEIAKSIDQEAIPTTLADTARQVIAACGPKAELEGQIAEGMPCRTFIEVIAQALNNLNNILLEVK